jgi:hypothetical protein
MFEAYSDLHPVIFFRRFLFLLFSQTNRRNCFGFLLHGSSGAVPASPDMRSSSSMRNSSVGPPGSPGGAVALFKYGSGEQVKTTPAGEYLTAALIDFNPDQYESDAAVADGANKLLMLVLSPFSQVLDIRGLNIWTVHRLFFYRAQLFCIFLLEITYTYGPGFSWLISADLDRCSLASKLL